MQKNLLTHLTTLKKLVFVVCCLVVLVPSPAHAELRAEIKTTPDYPKAYDPVTLTVVTYSFEADLATITWKINGKVVASGLGMTSLKTTMGGTGEYTVAEALIVLPNKDSLTVAIALSPQSVDLAWEAVESYTPPFYEGKSLPAEGALVRVTALPTFVDNGRLVDPSQIFYTWYVNDSVSASLSGIGKQVLVTRLDYFADETNFRVVAKTTSGLVAESTIKIQPFPISPVFYKYDPLLGVDLSKAITRRLEITKEISLKLEPYFISKVDGADSGDTYSWSMDNLPIRTQTPTLVVLKPKEKSYGVKSLSVSMQNTKRRLQEAIASLEVVFDSR